MSQCTPTPSTETEVRAQLAGDTPDIVVEAVGHHLETFREAKRRIADEGIVVRDMRGAVVAHPAIEVAKAAAAEIERIAAKWKKKDLAAAFAALKDGEP